LLGVCRRRLGQ